jgi:flagellar hook protein FlgE
MSLFGAMNTAISGLTAQSNAFGNISDNVANSQTVGFKRVDTSFIDYLTTSTQSQNESGSVVARPEYVNNVQGTITQTDNTLGLAIAGQGFFAVSQQIGSNNNVPVFDAQQFYTRAGDFQMNKDGYLVNSAGEFLNGWTVDQTTGAVNQNTLSPIHVTQTVYNPVATSSVTLSANLPATYTSPISSDIDVYDALGSLHTMTLNWVQNTPGDWTLSVSVDGTAQAGSAAITFGDGTPGSTAAGTVNDVEPGTGSTWATSGAYDPTQTSQAAWLQIPITLSNGSTQTIKLNLGTYGQSDGLTQYAGTQYNLRGLTQDGVPPGSFSSVTTQANGNIAVNYDNGQSRVIAQVPVITFNSPNELQRQDGQAFTATTDSGTPLAEAASTNGAGNLVTQSVESSNVDIASEFSKLIVAQRAYTASTKIVTSADQMLQDTINMKQ